MNGTRQQSFYSLAIIILLVLSICIWFMLKVEVSTVSESSTLFDNPTSDPNPESIFPDGYSKMCEISPIGEKQILSRNKRIIAYSLFYSDKDKFSFYFDGAFQNARGAKLYYPDWIVRIYVFGIKKSDEQKLLESSDNVELVRCSLHSEISKSPSRRMIARFLAHDDPKVSYVLSRDLDSRFSPRELLAVNQWLSSGASFHTMRDQYQCDPHSSGDAKN